MTPIPASVSREDVLAAAERLQGHVHRTPVLTCSALDARAHRRLFFKCENFQKGGSFKVRGALNALMALDAEVRERGVVAHSSGNFAQGLAIAAQRLGVKATIVMPSNAPAVKRAAVEGYGAQVVQCAPTLTARRQTTAHLARQTGATIVPPSDHPDVIAGQGTVALELLDQVADLDAIVAPLGGAGLLGGIALAAPNVIIVGAEPEGADDAWRSKQAGLRLGHLPGAPDTICDGLRTDLGDHTWPVVRDHVDHIVRVPDSLTRGALRALMERAKLVVEPSAAIALAAVTSSAWPLPDAARIGVVLSGGNIDLSRIPTLIG